MKKMDQKMYKEAEGIEGNGDFKRLPPGGYICQIIDVEDVPEKEYLKIRYDIAEGPYKHWWSTTEELAGFWGGTLYRSYKESATKFFKGFITAIETSNPGYTFDWDERTLAGKYIGLVLADEEYEKQDGSDGVRLYVARNTNVENIRKGDFKIPELKRLAKTEKNKRILVEDNFIDDGELPFK